MLEYIPTKIHRYHMALCECIPWPPQACGDTEVIWLFDCLKSGESKNCVGLFRLKLDTLSGRILKCPWYRNESEMRDYTVSFPLQTYVGERAVTESQGNELGPGKNSSIQNLQWSKHIQHRLELKLILTRGHSSRTEWDYHACRLDWTYFSDLLFSSFSYCLSVTV